MVFLLTELRHAEGSQRSAFRAHSGTIGIFALFVLAAGMGISDFFCNFFLVNEHPTAKEPKNRL
jgi:hypothetical protein